MVAPKSKQDLRLEIVAHIRRFAVRSLLLMELWSMVTRPRQSLEFEFAHTEAWHTLDSDLDYA
jgi:hypothetical protein